MVFVTVLAVLPARAQNPPPTVMESVGVSLVQVPVTVLDSSGAPVRGLVLSDFRVFDDGGEVKPDSLDVTEFPARGTAPEAQLPAGSTPNVVHSAALRRFLLLFDLSYITPAEFARARAAADRFVAEQLGEQDIVCVGSLSVQNGASFMKGFTRDRAELKKSLDELTLPAALPKPTVTISDDQNAAGRKGSAFTAAEMDLMRQSGRALDAKRMTQLIQTLGRLAHTFKKIDGRKQIVFFSHGFDMMVNGTSVLAPLKSALDELKRSDCVLHAVDTAGIREADDGSMAQMGSTQDVLYTMASETGGQLVANSNNFTGQLQRVLDATQVVYLLSFPSRPAGHPGKYHRLEVNVARKGVRVFARPGYEESE
jgi:VWFA-related protein